MAVREPSQTRTWRWTAFSGAALLVLLTVHMVAHHFAVEGTGGLRTYDQILDYIATPTILVIECLFIVVITIHAMLGLRSVLLDLGLSERGRARVNRWLVILGSVTVAYGLFLILTLASRA
jgi:succinate dehydrogenase hydrophobic anchor subunit